MLVYAALKFYAAGRRCPNFFNSIADGGGFMFTMPDIKGVMADVVTVFEAIAGGRETFISTVSAVVDMGREIPAPAINSQDFTAALASGKVLAKLPGLPVKFVIDRPL